MSYNADDDDDDDDCKQMKLTFYFKNVTRNILLSERSARNVVIRNDMLG